MDYGWSLYVVASVSEAIQKARKKVWIASAFAR